MLCDTYQWSACKQQVLCMENQSVLYGARARTRERAWATFASKPRTQQYSSSPLALTARIHLMFIVIYKYL